MSMPYAGDGDCNVDERDHVHRDCIMELRERDAVINLPCFEVWPRPSKSNERLNHGQRRQPLSADAFSAARAGFFL